ncbi:MAG: cupredoxin domain-containing protein [Gaiellaceae bacterium]
MKRILFPLAVCAAAVAVMLAVSPFAGARNSAQKKTTVNVTAKEYKFSLSRTSAPHGVVVFKVVNKGVLKHDFKIAGKKTPLLKHNQSATLTVTLKKGKSPYICTVKNHAMYGMKGTFKAT